MDHSLDELLHYDLYVGVLGGAGGIYLALTSPKSIASVVGVAIGIVGVVIGTVIAGVAVIAAFLDTTFLRKIHAIDRQAERYVTPFVFTAALGVISGLLLIFLAGLPVSAPKWLHVTLSGLAGLFTIWTITSVLPLLSTLLDFVGLKGDAAKVPDSVVSDENIHHLPQSGTGT